MFQHNTHDLSDIPAEEFKPIYDPDKTAFLRWQVDYLESEKEDLKKLKGALQVGIVHRPDLSHDDSQRYLKSILFTSGFTLFVCYSIISRLLSQIFSGKTKPDYLTKGEISITIGCLFAFLYLLTMNLKARHDFTEKKLTQDEIKIIINHSNNDLLFNKLVLSTAMPNLTVGDLIKLIDQQLLPKINALSNELTKSIKQPDLSLSLEAKLIQCRWLGMPIDKRLKWYESPLEQTFSEHSFAITQKY